MAPSSAYDVSEEVVDLVASNGFYIVCCTQQSFLVCFLHTVWCRYPIPLTKIHNSAVYSSVQMFLMGVTDNEIRKSVFLW